MLLCKVSVQSFQYKISTYIIFLYLSFAGMNHGILVIEMFLLSLVARYCYRRPNPDLELMPDTMSTATLRSSADLLENAIPGALKSMEDLSVPELGFSNGAKTNERTIAIDNGIQRKKDDPKSRDRSNSVVFTLGDKTELDKQPLALKKKKKTGVPNTDASWRHGFTQITPYGALYRGHSDSSIQCCTCKYCRKWSK